MARIIIGVVLVCLPLLFFIIGYYLGIKVELGGPGALFWVGVILIFFGVKSRRKTRGGEQDG